MRLFDPHCYDLACLFLDDLRGITEHERNDLASTIQQAIEDWMEGREDDAQQGAYDKYIDNKIDERHESAWGLEESDGE